MFRQFVVLSLMMTAVASGAEYRATTIANTALRTAPSLNALQVATLPAGTAVSVSVCFREGDYCHVTGAAFDGYVSGELLRINGEASTVLAAEQARWAILKRDRERGTLPQWDTQNIVVWGDSLSDRTLGDQLARLLPGRSVSMQGVPGETGAQIAERMLADTRFERRLKVIWDRHHTAQNPATYLRDLAPIIEKAKATGDFIVVSDIRQLLPSDNIPDPTIDAAITAAINEQLSRQYPDNFVDLAAILDDPETRKPDGLHLSSTGSERVARALAAAIEAGRPQ
jgi:lysophospholipase L1-like esterase